MHALPVAVVVLSIGAVLALLVPGKARSREPEGTSTTAAAPHSSATLQEGTA